MKVYCISGKAQNGKDTTAEIMRQELESLGNRVLVIHYADILKHICSHYFGWDGNKDERGREILQRVGTDEIRAKNQNYFVDFVASLLSIFDGEWDVVLIPDCRFKNEIETLREYGFDTKHIRVHRSFFDSPLTKEQRAHPSEVDLDDYPFDFFIDNGKGLDYLKYVIHALVCITEGANL